MEELDAKLKEIKDSIDEIEKITKLMERENSFLDFFDRIHKEVV